jgi:putative membrane protein
MGAKIVCSAIISVNRPIPGMSELDDPRVLYAAERTLLAWSRTNAGLMAFGFLVDRAGLIVQGASAARDAGFWIGLGFIVLGVVLNALSVVQYRRSLAALRPGEIPPGYWVNLPVFMTLAVGGLGIALAAYLVLT